MESAPTIIDALAEPTSYGLVEFACSTHSRLGRHWYSRHDGKLAVRIRLTEDDDMASSKGLKHAFDQLETYVGKLPVFLSGVFRALLVLLGNSSISIDRAGRRGVTPSPTSLFNFMRAS